MKPAGIPHLPAHDLQATAARTLWTLTKHGKRIDADMPYHAEYGAEIQFLHEGVMACGRRWTLRAQVIQDAGTKRAELEGHGWVIE